MHVQRVKIPLHGSAPMQREKVVRYCEISCRVPEYRQPQPETIREPEVASVRCDIPTRDGSLGREMITGVVRVGMVANAFLCDRGRSLNVLPEIEPHPTRFRVNSLNQRDKGSGSITLNGKTKAMHLEMSDKRLFKELDEYIADRLRCFKAKNRSNKVLWYSLPKSELAQMGLISLYRGISG